MTAVGRRRAPRDPLPLSLPAYAPDILADGGHLIACLLSRLDSGLYRVWMTTRN